MIWLIMVVTTVMMFLGFEMFLVLGIPSWLIQQAYYGNMPSVVLIQKMIAGIDNSVLMAIPFFIFAAELMSEGRIAELLSRSTNACFRRLPGGPAYGAIGSCMAFGSVCGSAPATIAALGRLMYPSLRSAGFGEAFSLGLIVSAAETALLIPPSITLIIYGWITETSISRLFAGGLIVGTVLGLAFGVLVLIEVWRRGIVPLEARVTASGEVIWGTAWALGMPLIILGGIYMGFVTATEAAAVAVIYAVFVEAVVFRALTFRKFMTIAQRCAILTSVIFILLATGTAIAYFVTLSGLPQWILGVMKAIDAGPYTFLMIVNVVLLIAGMFIDPGTAILVLIPALFPVSVSLGIDPVHFGLVVCVTACTAMITPPFGLDLFVASSTLNKPVVEVTRGVGQFIVANIVVLLIVTYVPGIATFLPNLLFGKG
ncbi:MAG: TRAP transporter large permease [Xanthobacteraceae bacterium]